MTSSPLHLKLAKQVLGDNQMESINNISLKNSPYIDYQPYQNTLRSKVLPDDQATTLKQSTLQFDNKENATQDQSQSQNISDFFDYSGTQIYNGYDISIQQNSGSNSSQQQLVNAIVQFCFMINPVLQLQKFQQAHQMTDVQIIQLLLDNQNSTISQMASHPQGNFAFQKLYTGASLQQKLNILDLLNLYDLSLHQHGTRSVQKVIIVSNDKALIDVIKKQIQGKIVEIALSQHGNHCVQKILEYFSPDDFDFVIQECAQQILKVACHQHGCCALQRSLDRCNDSQFYQLFDLIRQYAQQLVEDQYGNYVYQYLLDCNKLSKDEIDGLIQQLYGQEPRLTRMKSSSHVIEKCLDKGSDEVRHHIIDDLIQDESVFIELCGDRYANYVVQKLTQFCTPQQQNMITRYVQTNQQKLNQSQFSRHIINFILQKGK